METPNDANSSEELEADGYYGDDDLENEELDLSFLDEEDDDNDAKDNSSASPAK